MGYWGEMEALGQRGNTMEMEILPGNELPLICFASTLPHHFLCLVFTCIVFIYSSVSLTVRDFLPHRGSFFNPFEVDALLSSLASNLLFP